MKLVKTAAILFIATIFFLTVSHAYANNQNIDELNLFDKILRELVQEKIGDNRINIEVEYDAKAKSKLLQQEQANRIKSVVIENVSSESSSFKAKVIYIDDSFEYLLGRYNAYALVAVAAKYIKFGDIIQISDVKDLQIKIDSIKNTDFLSSNEVVGMQAKKYISMSSIIKKIDVANPPVIKNNDPVNIVYSSGVINLKTNGIALASGAVGDVIKVKNATSGAVLLGQIINKNTVRIGSNDNE